MSKEGYPASLNCWLKDFPQYIKITFGLDMGNLNGPWRSGSTINLIRIGFDSIDTSPVETEVSDNVKVYYSDTGTDEGWIFKIAMYGWGTFFAKLDEPFYFILLEKFVEFESTYFDLKYFRYREVKTTRILTLTPIPLVVVPIRLVEEATDDPAPITPVPPVTGNPQTNDSMIANLIRAYWWVWNIDVLESSSISYTVTNIYFKGYRKLAGDGHCYGDTAEFMTNGNQLKIRFIGVTIHCDDFILGQDPIGNCTYTDEVVGAANVNSLMINGQNRLSDLIRRA